MSDEAAHKAGGGLCPKKCHVNVRFDTRRRQLVADNVTTQADHMMEGPSATHRRELWDKPRSRCDGSGGYVRIFQDEFNEGTLDNATWGAWEEGRGGGDAGGSMTQSAVGHASNVLVENGNLVLVTRRATAQERHSLGAEYLTGAVTTRLRRHFEPGRLCVSAKLPGSARGKPGSNQGLWPAHWLMPIHANDFDQTKGCWPDLGEIDIMEQVNGEPSWFGTYHWNGKYTPASESSSHKPASAHAGVAAQAKEAAGRCSVVHDEGGHGEVQRCVPLTRWDERFHEFAVEWDGASFLSFFINAVHISTVNAGVTPPTRTPEGLQEGSPAPTPSFYDDPMFLMLQTAVGGPWPGEPTGATALPVHHVIDYVRYESRPRAENR